jgi:uncharacterized protein
VNDLNDKEHYTRREMLKSMNALLIASGSGSALSALAWGAPPLAASAGVQLRTVREIENTWIPMSDGTRLAARIWVPEDAVARPVPAIFNYCPYYARVFTRPGDDARFPYYASRGYACVRVDIRGSGNSEGRPQDEYVRQEQDDALEIISWIAKQPWCTGAIGMEGKSWSGFSSLQVAARQPPQLKAIISHCASDDRYLDDAHYKGGCVIADMLNWGTLLLAVQGQAQDPQVVGRERWRERWLERLNAVELNVSRWMDHPDRDDFWKHGSVSEDYSQITCPVYAIGGWVDAYKNGVFRLLAGLKAPRKGLVGPWTHVYPHEGVPGPAIGYLDEALRWWDHWLKGIDTGIMAEPMLRVWMQDRVPVPQERDVPGRWVAEEHWPSPRATEQAYFLAASGSLDESAGAQRRIDLLPLQTVGAAGGNWCPSGGGAAEDLAIEMALDQRLDDARSLVFDSQPLTAPIEILGATSVSLELAVDQPVAFVIVRLNDVLPTGESGRVSYGVLNLCHRDSHETPSALEPGRRYKVRVQLDHAAHRFAAGNRIRVAISSTYWPMILPAPEPVTLSLITGASRLSLPVRPTRPQDSTLPAFGPAYVPTVAVSSLSARPGERRIERDVGSGRQTIHHRVGTGVALLKDIDTRLIWDAQMRCEITDRDTASSTAHEFTVGWERGKLAPRIVASTTMTTTPKEFLVVGEINAFDGEEKVFTRRWEHRIARRLV